MAPLPGTGKTFSFAGSMAVNRPSATSNLDTSGTVALLSVTDATAVSGQVVGDRSFTVFVEDAIPGGEAFVYNLPAASTCRHRIVTIKRGYAGNLVEIRRSGSDPLEDGIRWYLTANGAFVTLQSTGNAWIVIGQSPTGSTATHP